MKKGFTLIELLAVIVILAIIALIAVPIILDIINSSKEESIERSEELYLSAVKNAIAKENLNDPNKEFNPTICKVNKDGNLSCTLGEEVITLNIEVEGERPCSGIVVIDNGEIVNDSISFGNCYYADNSGASIPDLMDTLTPVIYDEENKKWMIADPTSEWYNYDNGKWANAVILSETGKNKKIGEEINIPSSSEEIDTSDVQAMFVWIPRYSYTIKEKYGRKLNEADSEPTKALPGAIDIKFVGTNVKEDGSASYTDEVNNWYTHPAFTFGSVELSGIWVGKFETSGTIDNPTILPNQKSLGNQNVKAQFETAKKFNKILKNNGDSHVMKNSEWGAVAYLSQSIYGKSGNSDYTGVNKEVYKNNSSNYYTGRSSGQPTATQITEGTCKYDEEKSPSEDERMEGTGLCGPGASTTGNITGVYDMSGGAWEYVMGNFNEQLGSSGFSSMPESKYYDRYSQEDTTDSCKGNECKGHALNETKGWYGDYSAFVTSSNPWLARGGSWNDAGYAGVFTFGRNGVNFGMGSFRTTFVLIN